MISVGLFLLMQSFAPPAPAAAASSKGDDIGGSWFCMIELLLKLLSIELWVVFVFLPLA